jgi:hypothetical protein
MFGKITENKLKTLREITDNLHNITVEEIEKSQLPLFNKKFILEESKDLTKEKGLDSLLEKSVKLNINYAVRPKWTLLNYLYGGFDSKSADELLRKTGVFQFYKYYIDVISKFIKTNPLIFISLSQIQELIEETNLVLLEKLVTEITGVKIKNFFIQIFKIKYGEEKEITLDDSVPFVFIRLFLEDKNFVELLDKFKTAGRFKDDDEIELKTLIKVLMDKYDVSEGISAEDKNSGKEKDDLEKFFAEKKETVEKTETVKTKITKKIKIDNYEEEQKPDIEKSKIDIPTVEKNQIEEEISIQEPDGKNIRDTETKKIKRLFKEGELNIIAKKVFRSSRLSMFSAFDEMEKLKTWEEAANYLKEVFKKNNVDIRNKNVVLFVDLLNDFFINLEKGYI